MRSKREMASRISAVVLAVFLVAMPLLIGSSVSAHIVPSPCDFTTGGGFVLDNSGAKLNFGLVGGCKHGGFFGHVNIVDHSRQPSPHLSSTQITAYVDPFPPSKYRDICGTANTNVYGPVTFRVRTLDRGGPQGGAHDGDRFGFELSKNGVEIELVTTRALAGGNILLHKPNPSTTGPFMTDAQITAACGGLTGDDMGP